MSKSLIIVESPNKIKTLKKFLGDNFEVTSSVGHIKNLPAKVLGIDVENGFKPQYTSIPGKQKVLKELKSCAKSCTKIYLAPDPDREGEAISFHLAELLGLDLNSDCRITFNSITKEAVLEALKNPRKINFHLFEAQETRRILDRLVGYKLSPVLWKKVQKGLSAGRVQSVALLLICEREMEILEFNSEEYWHIDVIAGIGKNEFPLRLITKDGKKIKLSCESEVKDVLDVITGKNLKISQITLKESKKSPPPPFITSSLQQEAARKFGFTAKLTMAVAQSLYEGIEIPGEGQVGLITYMRTDSVRISPEGLKEAGEFILKTYGSDYYPGKPRQFASKGKNVQDAHEAIRPTYLHLTPESLENSLGPRDLKLYKLIYNRFIASQMKEALFDNTQVDAEIESFVFRAKFSVMKFDGFIRLYTEGKDETGEEELELKDLPELKKGDFLDARKIENKQCFTQPPPRFTEATLVKTLEKNGVGRPSTYAGIISTIQDRDYVLKREKKFIPTDLGVIVSELLKKNFSDIVNVEFTAKMEEFLDMVEKGDKTKIDVLSGFYEDFIKTLERVEKELEKLKLYTDVNCENCKGKMLVKFSKNGLFLGCENYPECKTTVNLSEKPNLLKAFKDPKNNIVVIDPETIVKAKDKEAKEKEPDEVTDEICEKCKANLVKKKGKFGEFLACPNFPKCKFTKPITGSLGIPCPKCDKGEIVAKVTRRRKNFFGCSCYPDCDFSTWNKPLTEKCSECGSFMEEARVSRQMIVRCSNQQCINHSEESLNDDN